MKLSIINTIKDLNENITTTNKVIAKKEKNKITYKLDGFNYILKIISPNKLILNRSNENLECTIFFESNKKTNSIYTLKKEDYTLEFEIKTNYLKITNKNIKINYTVIDSNVSYEYNIEMSEIK